MPTPQNTTQAPISDRLAIWAKGHQIPNRDPNEFRADDFGEAMRFDDFGNSKSEFGWQFAAGSGERASEVRPVNVRSNHGLKGRPPSATDTYRRN